MIPKLSTSSASEFKQNEESNVYSSHEVMLLNWINHHFEKEGQKLYGNSKWYMYTCALKSIIVNIIANFILLYSAQINVFIFIRYCFTYDTNI